MMPELWFLKRQLRVMPRSVLQMPLRQSETEGKALFNYIECGEDVHIQKYCNGEKIYWPLLIFEPPKHTTGSLPASISSSTIAITFIHWAEERDRAANQISDFARWLSRSARSRKVFLHLWRWSSWTSLRRLSWMQCHNYRMNPCEVVLDIRPLKVSFHVPLDREEQAMFSIARDGSPTLHD